MPKAQFGNWTIREDNLTIEHKNTYYVDLERCQTSAAVLDWIVQVAEKQGSSKWFKEDIADLVASIDAALRPQESLCSFGEEQGPIKDIRGLVQRNLGS